MDGHPVAAGDARSAEALLDALDAGAVLSVPFRYHASAIGRLHVARREPRPFNRVEAEFMRHVLEQVVPVLENLRLVDRLASDAADEERRRIARDLHDSVIQPYLGLRISLSAARAALAAGRLQEGEAQLGRLAELTEGEIETLRGYVRALRGYEGESGGLLDAGLRRLCTRFSEATGIHVDVQVEGQPLHNDRLAAEVFQMVAEALSNVRRHTAAAQVDVRIRTADNRVLLTVSNDATPAGGASFLPRSLAERTAALGGTCGSITRRPAPPRWRSQFRSRIEDELNPTSLFIIDDHPVLREGIKMLAESAGDVRVVGTSASASGAIDPLARHDPRRGAPGPRPRRGGRAGLAPPPVPGGARPQSLILTALRDRARDEEALRAGARTAAQGRSPTCF